MSIKKLEAGRADYAYRCVDRALTELTKAKQRGAYKSYTKKVPMMIKTNGLGATFAFAFAKGSKEPAWKLLSQQTFDWIKQERSYLLQGLGSNATDLPGLLINLESPQYRAVTVEVLALYSWLRRFAEGKISEEPEEG